MKRVIFCLLMFSLVSGLGCGKKLPSDFPKVYPISLTVTDGATPLTDVKVTFYPVSQGSAFSASGNTDASGVVKVITAQGNFTAEGIPAGEFIVAVEDVIVFDPGIPPEELGKMTIAEQNEVGKKHKEFVDKYPRKVPAVLKRSGKLENRSPIRFTAKEEKNELKIDVSEYKK